MRTKLFRQSPKTMRTGAERWVRILPDEDEGYQLYDLLAECSIGRLLFDADDNWIYDGGVLAVEEQEDVASFVSGNQKEMEELLRSIRK